MAVTLTTRPQYPLPEREIVASFSATLGDYVRVFCVAAPEGSEQRATIEADNDAPILLHEGDVGSNWRFTPGMPGRYQLHIVELDRNVTAHAGGWEWDSASVRPEANVGTTFDSIVVGRPYSQVVGWGENTGQLKLHLWDAYVRTVTKLSSGEDSPRLDAAVAAMKTASIDAAVAALGGVSMSALAASLATVASNWAAAFNAHCGNSGGAWHPTADTVNVVPSPLSTAVGQPAALVALFQSALRGHVLGYAAGNTPSTTGWGRGAYHGATTSHTIPQAPAPTSPAETFVALGELVLCYELHCASGSPAHSAADSANMVTVPTGTLLDVHYQVARALRQLAATTDTTIHSADSVAVAEAGLTALL
jgi:hypothetical protein